MTPFGKDHCFAAAAFCQRIVPSAEYRINAPEDRNYPDAAKSGHGQIASNDKAAIRHFRDGERRVVTGRVKRISPRRAIRIIAANAITLGPAQCEGLRDIKTEQERKEEPSNQESEFEAFHNVLDEGWF